VETDFKNRVHGLDSSASEWGPETTSCPHGDGPAGSWSINGEGGTFIDHLTSLKEEAAGVGILCVRHRT
jgi:hypothetical protein